jgi:hypothetical protein
MEAQLVQECQSAAGTVNLLVLISNTIKWSTIDGVVREERIGYEFSLEWIPPEPCVECPEPPVCPIEEPVCVFITASTDGRFVE